jgi:hypothetical protein
MDNLSALNLIIGFLSPIIIATINRPGWDSKVKVLVMVGFSVVTGFLTSLFSEQLNTEDVVNAVLTIMVSSIVSYQGIFKPTNVAAKIELKTSPERTLGSGDQSG